MDRNAHYRDCDACGYTGLDSAGATIVSSGVHVVEIQCAKCGHRQFSAYPPKVEQERAIEAAVAAVRAAQTVKNTILALDQRALVLMQAMETLNTRPKDEELYFEIQRDAEDELPWWEISHPKGPHFKTLEELIIALAEDFRSSGGGPPHDAATATGMYD